MTEMAYGIRPRKSWRVNRTCPVVAKMMAAKMEDILTLADVPCHGKSAVSTMAITFLDSQITGIPPYVKVNSPINEMSSTFDVSSIAEYFIFPEGHVIRP